MKITEKIDVMLIEDAQEFASSFNFPKLNQWIIKNYNKGYRSISDYLDIIKWIKATNPKIDEFDFKSALSKAKNFNDSGPHNYNADIDLNSNEVTLDYDDGSKWLKINEKDCNAICHKLQYDYSELLANVIENRSECWALLSAESKVLCAVVKNKNDDVSILYQYGKTTSKYYDKIKSLCVLKGIDLPIDAYSNQELVKAIKNGQINIEKCDIKELMSRLKPSSIISCSLLKYAHYCTIRVIYELYKMTNYSCLLKYALSFLICHQLMDLKAYFIIKSAAMQDEETSELFNNIKGNSTKEWSNAMENAQEEIINL